LLQVARGFGLEGKGYAGALAPLPSLKLPVIVHMVFNHFAVLEEYTPQRVLLADPGLGRHWLRHGGVQQAVHRRGAQFRAGAGLRAPSAGRAGSVARLRRLAASRTRRRRSAGAGC